MRVRKRVTLMVVTVTAIFGICWGTNQVVYLLRNVASNNIHLVTIAAVNTMVMFNSAVNPFVYALLNKQFREKIKRVIFCSRSLAWVHPTREHDSIELANVTTQPTNKAGSCSRGFSVPGVLVSSRRAPLF